MKLINEMLGRSPMMFLEEDSGGEAPSRGLEVFEGGDEPQPPTTTHEAEPLVPSQPQAPVQAPSTTTVDARQLASEFGQVLGQQFRPPPKQITAEEAKRLLNVWEPTPEWLAKYDNLETRNAAIAEQRDGMVRQIDTITQFRMREMMDQIQQSYGPVVQYMQQNEARAGEYRFNTVYPQLSSPGLRPVLFAVAQSLLANGARFNDERQMFETIAKGVESVIKVSNPEFKLGGGGNGGATPKAVRGRGNAGGIPVTTPGSGAGGSEPAAASGKKPRGLAIWD